MYGNVAPFSFAVIIPRPDFIVIHCQWLEAIFPCKDNTCSWRIHSHLMVAFFSPTSGRSKTNIICCHIFSSFDITWFVPVQGQSGCTSVRDWPQILNLFWKQSCRQEGWETQMTWMRCYFLQFDCEIFMVRSGRVCLSHKFMEVHHTARLCCIQTWSWLHKFLGYNNILSMWIAN